MEAEILSDLRYQNNPHQDQQYHIFSYMGLEYRKHHNYKIKLERRLGKFPIVFWSFIYPQKD